MKKTEIHLNKKFQNLFKQNDNIRYIILSGGRGNGKSFASALWLVLKFFNSQNNSLYLRQTLTNADLSTIPQFLAQVQILKLSKYFKVTHGQIQNLQGGSLFFKGFKTSSNNQDSNLKSIPHLQNILIEQATQVTEQQFDKLNLSSRDKKIKTKICLCFNPSCKQHWIYKRFFKEKNIEYDFNGIKDDTLYIFGTYLDNLENLNQSFLKQADNTKNSNILKYNNQFLGKWLDTDLNVLWTQKMIQNAHKIYQIPEQFQKISIGVDPAGSHNKTSDQTGIIVAGLKDQIIYVIQEKTGRYTPKQWGDIVSNLYNKYNANVVVAQSNFGGDMVQENIRYQHGNNIYIQMARAVKSKIVRAQPVAGLYQANKVKHLKVFQKLEYEQLTFAGDPKEKSPNSLDAAVYAIQWLYDQINSDSSGYF